MYLYVDCSIIYNSQIMEAAQVSFDSGMDKTMIYRYIETEIYRQIDRQIDRQRYIDQIDDIDIDIDRYTQQNITQP